MPILTTKGVFFGSGVVRDSMSKGNYDNRKQQWNTELKYEKHIFIALFL